MYVHLLIPDTYHCILIHSTGNDSNLLIVFYVQIMPDD
ncbi:YscQ/HrcQ family type III secretion apparatus protein, partial [Shigella flexneri]